MFIRRLLAWLMLLVGLLLAPAALAQSACTAMWGILSGNSLAYFNLATNSWVVAATGLPGNPNALAGSTANNLLYFVNRTTRELHSFDPNTGVVSAAIGTIPAPPAPAAGGNVLGATFDLSGRLHVYATQGSPNDFVVMAQISTATAATVTSWTQVLTTAGATPDLSGSGDMNCDNAGTCYMIFNTTPPTYHQVNTTPGASYARVNSPSISISGSGDVQVAGVAVYPTTGDIYFSTGSSGSTTYRLDLGTGVATLVFGTTAFTVADMGNCPTPPAAPTISKTITPSYASSPTGTATVVLSLGNSNTNPVWLNTEFRDNLPTGMVVANIPALTSTCSSSFGTPSVSVSSTSMTFAAGSRIPAGGCSITFQISATVSLNAYTNTIPAGSLSTTAGSNANAATATFKVGTDFSVVKSQANVVGGPYTTGTTTVGAGLTMQYVLTIVNSAIGGTGSVTFTDTLPILITPVLSITALQTGGGSCATLSAVVTGRTAISGTVTNAPPGATCTVTVTARGSSTVATPTTFQNTVTFTPTPSTGDANGANNRSTVTTTINPVANLQITKTNNVTSVNAGQTFSYTITVTNLGPANAAGAVVLDPAVSGLNCTTVTYASNPPGTVGTSPALVTINALQSTGVQLTPSFPTSSSATFRLTCGVTGTGVP